MIPFLRSVASGTEGEITAAVIADAVNEAPRSVSPDALRRFERWAAGGG